MAAKPKIFIAASERANLIAEKLRDELRKADYTASTWADEENSNPTELRFDLLRQLVKEYNFAVIIFAQDDMLKTVREARDSCVFEAGFFMAAFTPLHCILVSSVEKRELPAILEGIILYNFIEPEDFRDRIKCGQAIQSVTASVKDRLQQVEKGDMGRGAATAQLSRDELMAREKMTYEKGELVEGHVVVASIQPRELQYTYATRVRENLDHGIRYVYFVQGNDDAAYKIPRMLQLLLLAKLLKPEEAENISVRRDLVRANQPGILSDVKDICERDKLNIYFLSDPIDMEYCIFNATDRDSAKMYVKRRDEYIEWEWGVWANEFWGKTKKKTGADNPDPRWAMFHAVGPFKLNQEPLFSRLRRETVSTFPEIGEQVLDLCLKGSPPA